MPPSLGVNLRVTGQLDRGDRKYMEDFFSVAYQQTEDEKDLEYAFFGIFDGHGGREAAVFAKEHLMDFIVNDKRFWSDDDDDVLQAISNGYIQTHYAMWKDQVNWPKTSSGLPSTSGTTASIAFIRKGKIYIGHVGDSSIVLGYQVEGESDWRAEPLTKDHKPEDANEVARIRKSGGKVVRKSGVPRVVWNRPRLGHKGPVRRSTPIDEIPFLAVARSLGDLWSYNSDSNQFVVSPQPDVQVIKIDVETHRCLIFGTDGLWNMLSPADGVYTVQCAERHNEKFVHGHNQPANSKNLMWINPSRSLVSRALNRWLTCGSRADNTSAVTLLLDPPGPPRRRVLQRMRIIDHPVVGTVDEKDHKSNDMNLDTATINDKDIHSNSGALVNKYNTPNEVTDDSDSASSKGGVAIFTTIPSPPVLLNSPQSESLTNCESIHSPSKCSIVMTPLSSDLVTVLQHEQPCFSTGENRANCKGAHQDSINGERANMLSKQTMDHPASLSALSVNHGVSSSPGDLNSTSTENNFSTLSSSKPCVESMETTTQQFRETFKEDGNTSHHHSFPETHESVDQSNPEPFIGHSLRKLRGSSCRHISDGPNMRHNLLKSNPCNDVAVRRRHSSVLDVCTTNKNLGPGFMRRSLGFASSFEKGYQPGSKRRTRSEDKMLQNGGHSEEDMRTSDEENERVRWPVSWVNKLGSTDGGSEENNARSCQSRRKKKWLRLSGNSLKRLKQARPSGNLRQNTSYITTSVLASSRECSEEENCSRVLRSDTLASLPVRTLRSRNVDLKAPRLSLHASSKLTPKRSSQLKTALDLTSSTSPSNLLHSSKVSLTSSVSSNLSKRHRQTFCGRTRSMTTRSRVKRLSK